MPDNEQGDRTIDLEDRAVQFLSPTKRRLLRSAAEIEGENPDTILYQHTVFCQIGMPYRDLGPDVREWEREQGRASLLIEAGRAKDPKTGEWGSRNESVLIVR